VSLLLSDILQAIGSIINAAWMREEAVIYGSLCTAQGAINLIADVSIALWSLVIATRIFIVLFLRLKVKRSVMWLVMISQWSLIGAIGIAGPATVGSNKHGPFYGIADYWCWISPNYIVYRIVLDYILMYICALFMFILYTLVYLKLRGIVRAQTRSTFVGSTNQERKEEYDHKLARQMLLFPISYTIMTLPIGLCRVIAWSGHRVSFSLSIVSYFIYLLTGLVHVILFASIRRILPPRSMYPKFLISNPKVVSASTDVTYSDFTRYHADVVTKRPQQADSEQKRMAHQDEHGAAPTPSVVSGTIPDPRDPFADPVQPPIEEENIIKRVHSPDSEYDSGYPSPHHTPRALSPVAIDYVDRTLLAEQAKASSPGPALTQGEQSRPSEQGSARLQPTHREGEELEVPMSARSTILRYYEGLEL